jgi:hypothetical protein
MTYIQSRPETAIKFTAIPGVAVVDHYEHRQTKIKDGAVCWSVMDADRDLGEIWVSEGRYFSKFSTNDGNESLDDAIAEILEATNSMMSVDDYDTYPANDAEFVKFMTAPISKAFKVEPFTPKDQTEAIAMQDAVKAGGTWLSAWSDGEVNCDRVVPGRYRQIATLKVSSNGSTEFYVGAGVSIGRNKIAESIDDAIAGVKRLFVNQQSMRYSAIWTEYVSN